MECYILMAGVLVSHGCIGSRAFWVLGFGFDSGVGLVESYIPSS